MSVKEVQVEATSGIYCEFQVDKGPNKEELNKQSFWTT